MRKQPGPTPGVTCIVGSDYGQRRERILLIGRHVGTVAVVMGMVMMMVMWLVIGIGVNVVSRRVAVSVCFKNDIVRHLGVRAAGQHGVGFFANARVCGTLADLGCATGATPD